MAETKKPDETQKANGGVLDVGDSGVEGDEDNGVTLVEVLEEEAQLQEDADAVLGGSDDANCTYSLVWIAF